jgi:hypothetical protein
MALCTTKAYRITYTSNVKIISVLRFHSALEQVVRLIYWQGKLRRGGWVQVHLVKALTEDRQVDRAPPKNGRTRAGVGEKGVRAMKTTKTWESAPVLRLLVWVVLVSARGRSGGVPSTLSLPLPSPIPVLHPPPVPTSLARGGALMRCRPWQLPRRALQLVSPPSAPKLSPVAPLVLLRLLCQPRVAALPPVPLKLLPYVMHRLAEIHLLAPSMTQQVRKSVHISSPPSQVKQ